MYGYFSPQTVSFGEREVNVDLFYEDVHFIRKKKKKKERKAGKQAGRPEGRKAGRQEGR